MHRIKKIDFFKKLKEEKVESIRTTTEVKNVITQVDLSKSEFMKLCGPESIFYDSLKIWLINGVYTVELPHQKCIWVKFK